MAAYFALAAVDPALGTLSTESGVGLLCGVFALGSFVPNIAVTVRRLHDVGKSGWWYLVAFVPVVGQILFLHYMLRDSEPHANDYGPSPKPGPHAPLADGSSASIGLRILARVKGGIDTDRDTNPGGTRRYMADGVVAQGLESCLFTLDRRTRRYGAGPPHPLQGSPFESKQVHPRAFGLDTQGSPSSNLPLVQAPPVDTGPGIPTAEERVLPGVAVLSSALSNEREQVESIVATVAYTGASPIHYVFPFVGGRVRNEFDWRERRFAKGTRQERFAEPRRVEEPFCLPLLWGTPQVSSGIVTAVAATIVRQGHEAGAIAIIDGRVTKPHNGAINQQTARRRNEYRKSVP